MEKTVISIMILTSVLTSLISTNFKLQQEETWTGIIYIRNDGNVDPIGAPVQRNGTSYVLTGNVVSNAHGIIVERDNITLDGNGYTVEGKHAYATFGIYLLRRKNVTITNVKVRAFWYCVRLEGSTNNHISKNTITDNHVGIGLFQGASNNIIFENTIKNNTHGIWLKGSSNNTLRNNKIDDNTYTFNLDSSVLAGFINDVDTSNTVNNKPIYYWINKHHMNIATDAGFVALINCTHIKVQSLNLTGNGQTIILIYTTNSEIVKNKITTKDSYNIYFFESSNNSICGNEIAASNQQGIWLFRSSNNTIVNNNITNNMYGLVTFESSNNKIFHNNFINNTYQIYDDAWESIDAVPSINEWDDGYPSGGNYWSDHHEFDFFSGIYQNESGKDGISDTPYRMDKYPLEGPILDFVVVLEQHIYTISNSTISNFQFKDTTITFNALGKIGTEGFCRISVPTTLMNGTPIVVINGKENSYILLSCSNTNCSYLYFSYNHPSEIKITLYSSKYDISILSIITLMFILIAVSLILIHRLQKKEQTSKRNSQHINTQKTR